MTLFRSLLITTALVGTLAACGSDDDTDASADGGVVDVDPGSDPDGSADADADADADSGSDSGDPGSGSATIILADGTVYDLEVTECEGHHTDPRGYPDEGGFAITGENEQEDRRFHLARVGPIDEPYVQTGVFEGDSDETGGNEELIYSAQMETMEITIGDGSLSGSVDTRAVGPNRPFGDSVAIEFDFSC